MPLLIAVAVILSVAVLSGCASSKETTRLTPDLSSVTKYSPLTEPVRDYLATSPERDTAKPLSIPDSDEAPVSLTRTNDPLPTIPVQHFDMGREADIAIVLRALARGADINLVLGAGVAGPVLLSLPDETSWAHLFEIIVETHGLHYEFRNGLLRVMAKEDVERQIAMERALQEREIAREERMQAEPVVVELYRVRYANASAIASALMAGSATASENASNPVNVITDADSGLLIIQAPPAQMTRILHLAQQLDQPTYQILIEASIVQTNSDIARDLGIQWSAYRPYDKLSIGVPVHPDGWNSNFPAGFEADAAGFAFGLERNAKNLLRMQLTALQKDGQLRIVSNPSITTLDKQTAIIQSGEERPFQTSSGSGATATPTIEFKKALLSLEVTPQVIDETWIKLHIKTTKDDFDDSRPVVIDGSLQVPVITRAATTILYLADGQTTVIGGLSTNAETNQETGIPLLKDIPGLGALFRNSNKRDTFNDTLIFITPRILRGETAANASSTHQEAL